MYPQPQTFQGLNIPFQDGDQIPKDLWLASFFLFWLTDLVFKSALVSRQPQVFFYFLSKQLLKQPLSFLYLAKQELNSHVTKW